MNISLKMPILRTYFELSISDKPIEFTQVMKNNMVYDICQFNGDILSSLKLFKIFVAFTVKYLISK